MARPSAVFTPRLKFAKGPVRLPGGPIEGPSRVIGPSLTRGPSRLNGPSRVGGRPSIGEEAPLPNPLEGGPIEGLSRLGFITKPRFSVPFRELGDCP